MVQFKRIVASVALFCSLATVGFALTESEKEYYVLRLRDPNGPTKTWEDVQPGVWQSNLEHCRKYAETHNVPLVAVWSNQGCGHCKAMHLILGSESFTNWMAKTGIVFCYLKSTDGALCSQSGAWYKWCYKAGHQTQFPLVRFYWKEFSNPTDNKYYTVGDLLRAKKSGAAGEAATQANILAAFPGYTPKPPTPPYKGGNIGVTNIPTARLEAQIGSTANVKVPLIRTADVAAEEATNQFKARYKDYELLVTNLVWSAGETQKVVTVPVVPKLVRSGDLQMPQAGDKATLELFKEVPSLKEGEPAWELVESSAITYVDVPNSSANPLWIGERTAKTLQAGEWTMDLDVAKERTASQQGNAYTLVMVSGSLWCPNCTGCEDSLLSSEEFKTWALENNVALVEIDTSRVDSSSRPWKPIELPTLLRPGVGRGVNSAPASGLGYLSRKEIVYADAEAIAKRNVELTYKTWLIDNSAKDRLGNPTFLLLRKDGTIAGRLNAVENKDTRDFPTEVNINRLNALLALADNPSEELNDYVATTTLTHSPLGSVEGELDANDLCDAYRLTGVVPGVPYQISGEIDLANNYVCQVVKVDEAKTQTVVATAEQASDTLTFILDDGTADYFILVKHTPATNFTGTVAYNLDRIQYATLAPTESATTLPLDPETMDAIEFDVVDGAYYLLEQLEGLQGNLSEGDVALQQVPGNGTLYQAKGTGRVCFTATQAGQLKLQIWRPGTISWAVQSQTYRENLKTFTLALIREGGLSGDVTATLSYDGAAVTNNRIVSIEPTELVWQEGVTVTNLVTVTMVDDLIYVGDDTLDFTLALTQGQAENNAETYQITIQEDDQPIVGELRFMQTLIYAEEGTDLEIAVERIKGVSTTVNTVFNTPYGELSDGTLVWLNNSTDVVQRTTLTLPTLEQCPRGYFTMTLLPAGIKAARGGDKLTIRIYAADAPKFASESIDEVLTQYVNIDAPLEMTDVQDYANLSLKRISGSMPSGVKLTVDKTSQLVRLEGTPTRVGTYQSVWQVSERRGRTTVAGSTIAINLVVGDITQTLPSLTSRRTIDGGYVEMNNVLAGQVTRLTLSKDGKHSLSMKLYDEATLTGISASFRSTGWEEVTDESATANLYDRKTSSYVSLTTYNDGRVEAFLMVKADKGDTWEAYPITFADAGATDFSPYAGYYTVALPVESGFGAWEYRKGYSYLTLKMNTASAIRKGKVTYSGVLVGGKSLSGSATLIVNEEDGCAYLPIFKTTKNELISGLIKIKPNGAATYKTNPDVVVGADNIPGLVWLDYNTKGYPYAVFVLHMGVYGTYFNAKDDLATCCYDQEQTTELSLRAESEGLLAEESPDLGTFTEEALPTVGVKVSSSKLSIISGSNPTRLRISFNKNTGVFNGTFTLEGSKKRTTATYKGIIVPGWNSDCGCSPETELPASVPFGAGSFWFRENFYPEENNFKRVNIQRSDAITLSAPAPQTDHVDPGAEPDTEQP